MRGLAMEFYLWVVIGVLGILLVAATFSYRSQVAHASGLQRELAAKEAEISQLKLVAWQAEQRFEVSQRAVEDCRKELALERAKRAPVARKKTPYRYERRFDK